MKLHLPSSLRKALFALFAVAAAQPAMAASMSTYVPQAVYCDFGDNSGLYSVHGVNDLLTYLRDEEGGIYIYYNAELGVGKQLAMQPDQPLISFESRMDSGPGAAVSYNILATVEHNGVQNPTFTATKIGASNAIHYYGIEYRKSGSTEKDAPFEEMNVFRLVPQTDFKITRLSKIVTDVSTYDFCTEPASTYKDQTWYRSGSGTMYQTGENGQNVRWGGAYSYCIGGIMDITNADNYANYGLLKDFRGVTDTSGSVKVNAEWWKAENIKGGSQPLPFCIQSGDSGSPTWIYDSENKTYLYAGAMQSGEGSKFSQARYAGQWAKDTENYFNVDIGANDGETIRIGKVEIKGTEHYDAVNNITSRPYKGVVTREDGSTQNFIGVRTGVNTWNSLSGLKDSEKWYAYDNSYLNSKDLTYADLFETENIVFTGKDGGSSTIMLEATVDTGIGYARFCKEEGGGITKFILKAGDKAYQLNTAGFVVEKGVDLHISLTGDSSYMREWRKTGEGNLHIEGENNNDILLNLGGSGTTYLQRTNGYAAYNVLANNGTTVVIQNKDQIKRDFTFGFGGALLDMHGESMEWNNGNGAAADGFTIHALTDEALITNAAQNTTTKLTWTQQGTDLEYLGSFVDTENGGALQFEYAGGDGNKLTLHSIYTNLHNTNADNGNKSGIIVTSGTLALQGTVTQHAPGSRGASFSNARLVNNDDWHYADMTTPVTVKSGGIFELGSHARLKGLVTVQDGGTFVMREGVTHQMEYLEGYYIVKNTDAYRKFFGLHGNVELQGPGATMKIEFHDNVDSHLVYDGNISGDGSLVVDPGAFGGLVTLSGNNTSHTGSKTLQRGGMLVTDLTALGNTDSEESKWLLTDSGYLVVGEAFADKTSAQVLEYINSGSNGILALTQSSDTEYNLDSHKNLIIGAAEGCTVNYGKLTDELKAQPYGEEQPDGARGYWKLGGGGGEICVYSHLSGDNDLLLGAAYAKGSVYLKNTNDFTGTIVFNGGVTLKYDDDSALGTAKVNINYTNRIALAGSMDKVMKESSGVILIDKIKDQDLSLSGYSSLAIGSEGAVTYTRTIAVDKDAAYNFGGATGVLTIESALAANGTNDLMLDGQTFVGGEIRLNAATAISGQVVVRGCDTSKSGGRPIEDSGDITLGLGTEDAIRNTTSVTLMRGGYLDLHGTSQHLKDLSVSAGGAVFSSDAAPASLDVQLSKNLSWVGSVQADTVHLRNSDKQVTLTLGGTSDYREMHIHSGVIVSLAANNALAAMGATIVESGATLNMNGHSAVGNIIVREQGTLSASGGTAASISGYVTLDGGTMSFSKEGSSLSETSTLISNGGTVIGQSFSIKGLSQFQGNTIMKGSSSSQGGITFSGTVEIDEGVTLTLKDTTGFNPILGNFWTHYNIDSAEFNTPDRLDEEGHEIISNGTLRVETRDLRLGTVNQEFGGVVELSNGASQEIKISAEKGTKIFDTLLMNNDKVTFAWLPKTKPQYQASNADWIIHHLESGEDGGNLNFNLTDGHYVKLDGAGSFNKTLSVQGGMLVLETENAMPSGVVNLTNGASLAVNAASTQIGGLKGDSTAHLYAGNEQAEGSTRNGTLVIATEDSETFVYNGAVQPGEQCGISIVKEGAGTQTFAGNNIDFQDVTVTSGTLSFTHETTTPTIHGDVSVAQGAMLDIGSKTLMLGTEQALCITAGDGNAATLKGNLKFAGGKVEFDSGILLYETPVFHLTGAATYQEGATSLVVNFTNEETLALGSHLLSDGDWSTIMSNTITSDSLIYHTATFTANAKGLSVDIANRADMQVWTGTTTENSWTTQKFGSEESLLSQDRTAVFNDTAENSNVVISESVRVKEMVFDNDRSDYHLETSGDADVKTVRLRQVGKETTELHGDIQAEFASVEAGTLVMLAGSTTGSIQVEAQGTITLKDNNLETGLVSGDGTLRVDWGSGKQGSVTLDGIANLAVDSGHLKLSGDAAITQSLSIAENAITTLSSAPAWNTGVSIEVNGELLLEGQHAGVINLGTATGSGRIELCATSNYNNEIKVGQGDSFIGTTNLTGGRLNLNKSSFGKTLEVDNTVEMLMHTQVNLASDLVIDKNATLRIFQDSSGGTALLNINGTLSGEGTYERRGVAPLEVNGEVNLHKFVQANDAARNPGTNFNNTVTLDELVLKSGSVRFYKAATLGSAEVNGGIVDIKQSVAIKDTVELINGNTRVSISHAEGEDSAVISGDVSIGNNGEEICITGTDGSRIDTSLIDLAAGTRLEMANVTLGASSCITDDNAVLVANGLTVEADILSNLKPLTYGDAAPSPVEEPADMVSFTLSNIQDVVIDGKGTGLVVRMVGNSSQELSGAEWMRLGLGGGDLAGQFADSLAVTLLYQDATGLQRSAQGVYTWEDVEEQAAIEAAAQNHNFVYFRLSGTVPEPATSTLSLLALAALAARRRRK